MSGILTDFSFYLGRIDRVYLTKDGVFQVKYGTPAENPEKPTSVDDALEIATITLPPFLYNITDADKRFLEHKRYRMVDIKQLENRIKNLEFYLYHCLKLILPIFLYLMQMDLIDLSLDSL